MTDNSIKPYPLITQAIRDGETSKIDGLLANFPEMMDFKVPSFGTWLHYASAHGPLMTVEYFLKRGFSVNSKQHRAQRTPLDYAATKGRPEIVKYLLDQGAQMDVSGSVGNPLFGAIVAHSEGGIECARLLIDAGIDVDASYVLQGTVKVESDAVAFAVLHGQREIAHMVALKKTGGGEEKAQELIAEGVRIAELRTAD